MTIRFGPRPAESVGHYRDLLGRDAEALRDAPLGVLRCGGHLARRPSGETAQNTHLPAPAGGGVRRKVQVDEVLDSDHQAGRPEPRTVIVDVEGATPIPARKPRVQELDTDVRLVQRNPAVNELSLGKQSLGLARIEAVQPVFVAGRQVSQQVKPHGGGTLRRPAQDVDIDADPHVTPGLSSRVVDARRRTGPRPAGRGPTRRVCACRPQTPLAARSQGAIWRA